MSPTTAAALPNANWRKSSRSGDVGACVEVAVIDDSIAAMDVAVRDSKDPAGPVLRFSPTAWSAFAAAPPVAPTTA